MMGDICSCQRFPNEWKDEESRQGKFLWIPELGEADRHGFVSFLRLSSIGS